MLRFGTESITDLLSWIIVVALGAKLVATVVLLAVDKTARDRPGWGTTLWWITKLTPVIAVPCLIWLALRDGDRDLLWLAIGLGVFVAVAVPLKIRQRRARIARDRGAERPLSR